jgi:hypothetical protein
MHARAADRTPHRAERGGIQVSDFRPAGTGLTVYEDDAVIEGPLRWLDSPSAVIEFVNSGRAAESIVLARGGTTTFLTPALTSGVKGVMTLQGAPESHLGILSREYGIPCLMSVSFTSGVRTSRGEVIPADGTIVRLDVSSSPKGQVFAEVGAGSSDVAGPALDPSPPAGPSAEELAQIQHLLTNYQGHTPLGSEGDRIFRQRLATNVLLTGDDHRELSRPELNDLLAYMGFNFWDCLAARATEGESGLIPRQEYEALGCVQIWQRYPEILRFITREIGVDGLHEIGGLSRREIGTKANLLHMWSVGMAVGFGRGIALGLGRVAVHERERDLADSLQFVRRLYHGVWGGPGERMYTSMRGYTAPLLDAKWITRFQDDVTSISDPDTRSRYQRFSANTELMGFLLHYDCRVGLHDSGPYPTPDGGFVIVRDHFLSDDLYHWADVAAGLPYAITQAMFFTPDSPLEVALKDVGTIFTKPANYLKYMTGMAVYARDRWDSPVSEIRRVDDAEMDVIQQRCRTASTQLYQRIASMSRRDKVMAGGQVYYTDFIAPFARAAGLWDRLKDELDFFEWDRLASDAYYDLVIDGVAAEMVPRLFLTGTGFPPVTDPVDPEAAMPALHRLALRGACTELPVEPGPLADASLISETSAGYLLTEAGKAMHERGLVDERGTYDTERLSQVYQRFLALNGQMKGLAARWHSADDVAREDLLVDIAEIIDRVTPTLRRTTEVLDRFGPYRQRLHEALERAEKGDHNFVTSPRVDSVHTVWMELHEDYLLTQGISREQEGSY